MNPFDAYTLEKLLEANRNPKKTVSLYKPQHLILHNFHISVTDRHILLYSATDADYTNAEKFLSRLWGNPYVSPVGSTWDLSSQLFGRK